MVLLIVTTKLQMQPRLEAVDHRTNPVALRVIIVIGGFILLNQFYLAPQTSVFRPSSDPSTPPAQHLVQVNFGNSLELVGYDIAPDPARAGDLMIVRLYWRRGSEQPQPELRAAVHITAFDGREDWGGTESLTFAALPPDHWNTSSYVIDQYQFRLHSDASPYLGELRVAVFGSATDTPSTTIKVAPLRVTGDRRVFSDESLTINGAVSVTLSSVIKSRCSERACARVTTEICVSICAGKHAVIYSPTIQ